ncbi:MAG: hypothetical protein NTZ02_04170 [Candidatus Woesearchaeota archaeon]|nr:hypothetical protein [Candidatus Woesearchaeota archaeon]
MAEETLDNILKIFSDKTKVEELSGHLDENIMYAVINMEVKKDIIPEEIQPAIYALMAEKLEDYDGSLADEIVPYYKQLYQDRITEITK